MAMALRLHRGLCSSNIHLTPYDPIWKITIFHKQFNTEREVPACRCFCMQMQNFDEHLHLLTEFNSLTARM